MLPHSSIASCSDINFNAVTFADVIDFLRDVTGSNIVVDWTVLEAAGIDKSVPITLRLRDIKFSTVLQKVLDQASPTKGQIGYEVGDGIITISTTEALRRRMRTRMCTTSAI